MLATSSGEVATDTLLGKSRPTFTGAGHQWTVSTNIDCCNQWLSLAKPVLKVIPVGGNRLLVVRPSKCGWAMSHTIHIRADSVLQFFGLPHLWGRWGLEWIPFFPDYTAYPISCMLLCGVTLCNNILLGSSIFHWWKFDKLFGHYQT